MDISPEQIAENLAAVRARLPAHVTLVAVSKLQPAEAIRAAYAAGQRDFGENYVQEWRGKAAALADLADLRWHLIGALQANKAKYVAGACALVHGLESAKVASELDRRAAARGALQPILVQVNVAREPQKGGVAVEELPTLLAELGALPHLRVAGLMTIPPAEADPRPHFAALRELAKAHGLAQLSMGMSADWPLAVEEGATLVRVGTAIFGHRHV